MRNRLPLALLRIIRGLTPVIALLMTAPPAFAAGPALSLPADNSSASVTLPYFDWSDFVTSPFAGSYEIQIDDTQNFSSPVAAATLPAVVSFYSPHAELAQGAYYWRVRYLDAGGTPSDWSSTFHFSVSAPYVIDVVATDGWAEIKTKLQQALLHTATYSDYAELRFPVGGSFQLTQVYDPLDPSSEYLFYVKDGGNVIINGRDSTVVITATSGTCGFFYAQTAARLQLKNFTLDYTADSLSQFGGTLVAIEDDGVGLDPNGNPDTGHRDATTNLPTPATGTATRGFTVEVDPAVYPNSAQNSAQFAQSSIGFFVDAEHQQRIGRQGVEYTMNQTWTSARIGTTNRYRFTESSPTQVWWNRYAGELKVGDFFVSTDRGGDVIWLFNSVDDFVANNLTVNGSRGRYFVVRRGSSFNRSINNHFLRTQNRILGGPSGGVNDKGNASWHENVTIEYTRDDSFHTSTDIYNPGGAESVLLNSTITGAFRNSAWIQADRSWIEGNTIRYAGTDGIALGGSGIDTPSGSDTQVAVGLIRNNTVISPRSAGIVSRPSGDLAPDPDNQYITLTGNTVRDHQSDEAILLEHLASSVVSDNKVESTAVALYPFNSAWRLYSDPALQMGFHVAASQDVAGTGNEVRDPRISCANRRVVEPDSSNIDADLTGPSAGIHESWNCASVAAFTATGTLAGDHTWSIHADNFRVETLDNAILGSRGFGRVVSDVLPGQSATAVDKHTAALPQSLSPGSTGIRIQARFVFNELTTLGRAEARVGVEDSTTGAFYQIGLTSNTTTSPVIFYAQNPNSTVSVGSAGDQTTSGVWEIDATFRRASSTTTTVDYLVKRPNGAPYSGTATLSNAVGAAVPFDQAYLAFKQRGQVVFDSIQITTAD